MKWNPTNLQILRESAGVSQMELAARSGINQSKISLIENHLLRPSPEQEQKLQHTVYAIAAERAQTVQHSADPRLQEALRTIRSSPTKKALHQKLQRESGYSESEAALLVLGRRYPGRGSREPMPNDRYGVE
jgi:transcriptional regulator with XRE-family HTH domain